MTERIDWGTYVHMVYSSSTIARLEIYGQIYTLAEIEADERALGVDDVGWEATKALLEAAFERGLRYGRWYSVVVPDGELGSHHAMNLTPITAEAFDTARHRGWG